MLHLIRRTEEPQQLRRALLQEAAPCKQERGAATRLTPEALALSDSQWLGVVALFPARLWSPSPRARLPARRGQSSWTVRSCTASPPSASLWYLRWVPSWRTRWEFAAMNGAGWGLAVEARVRGAKLARRVWARQSVREAQVSHVPHWSRSPSYAPQVAPLLKPTEKCWQPSDFLPPSEDPYFMDQVRYLWVGRVFCGCDDDGWAAAGQHLW